MDVYECCPKFENESFLLRPVMEEDCDALLKVYSDPQAVPLFNSDNCGGDTFYYTTRTRMAQALDVSVGWGCTGYHPDANGAGNFLLAA